MGGIKSPSVSIKLPVPKRSLCAFAASMLVAFLPKTFVNRNQVEFFFSSVSFLNVRPRQMDSSCCFASLFFTGVWLLPRETKFGYVLATKLVVCFAVESMDSHGDCYKLLSIFCRFAMSSSLFLTTFGLVRHVPPLAYLSSLFPLITVLIPLHGWRFGMNKLSSKSNRWLEILFIQAGTLWKLGIDYFYLIFISNFAT